MGTFVPLVLGLHMTVWMALTPAAKPRSQPIVLDFQNRPVVSSPDGKWYLTVSGGNTDPWLILRATGGSARLRLLRIARWCEVQWREDSTAFSLIDARYANHYFLLVELVEADAKPTSTDLSPSLERVLRASLRGRYDTDKIYVRAFRWLPDGTLLAGVDAVIFKTIRPLPRWQPAENLYRGYVIDVSKPRVVRELDLHAMLSEYGIDLQKETW